MKDFKELINGDKSLLEGEMIENFNEQEIKQAEEIYKRLLEHIENNNTIDIDEGLLGSIVGGAAGYLVGPALGRGIAKALGIEKGILYDVLTSKLVTAALGSVLLKDKI